MINRPHIQNKPTNRGRGTYSYIRFGLPFCDGVNEIAWDICSTYYRRRPPRSESLSGVPPAEAGKVGAEKTGAAKKEAGTEAEEEVEVEEEEEAEVEVEMGVEEAVEAEEEEEAEAEVEMEVEEEEVEMERVAQHR